eukprot:jgi/Bigna1/71869/fgenesh1_pg.17_\
MSGLGYAEIASLRNRQKNQNATKSLKEPAPRARPAPQPLSRKGKRDLHADPCIRMHDPQTSPPATIEKKKKKTRTLKERIQTHAFFKESKKNTRDEEHALEWGTALPVSRDDPRKALEGHKLKKLSQVILKKYKNEVEPVKLVAVGQDIGSIDQLPRRLRDEVRALYLGNNFLTRLKGLLQFPNLRVASLANNLIEDVEHVREVGSHSNLESLYLDGNPIAELPNYKIQLLAAIPHLRMLDGRSVARNDRARAVEAVKRQETMLSLMFENDLAMRKLRHSTKKMALHFELHKAAYGRAAPREFNVKQLLNSAKSPPEEDEEARRIAKRHILKRVHKRWLSKNRHVDPLQAPLSILIETWSSAMGDALAAQQKHIGMLVTQLEEERKKLSLARRRRKAHADTEGILQVDGIPHSEKSITGTGNRLSNIMDHDDDHGPDGGESKAFSSKRGLDFSKFRVSTQTKLRQMGIGPPTNSRGPPKLQSFDEEEEDDNKLLTHGGWVPDSRSQDYRGLMPISASASGFALCDVWTQTPPDQVVVENLHIGQQMQEMQDKMQKMSELNVKLRERLALFQKQNLENVQQAEAELRSMSSELQQAQAAKERAESETRTAIKEHETYREAAENALRDRTEVAFTRLTNDEGDEAGFATQENKRFCCYPSGVQVYGGTIAGKGHRLWGQRQIDQLKGKAGAATARVHAVELEKHTLRETVLSLKRALEQSIQSVEGGDAAAKVTARRVVELEGEAASLRTRLRLELHDARQRDYVSWMDGASEESRRKHLLAISHRYAVIKEKVIKGWGRVIAAREITDYYSRTRYAWRLWKEQLQIVRREKYVVGRNTVSRQRLAVRYWRKKTTEKIYAKVRFSNANRQAHRRFRAFAFSAWKSALTRKLAEKDRNASIMLGKAVSTHQRLATKRSLMEWRGVIKNVVLTAKNRSRAANRFRYRQAARRMMSQFRRNTAKGKTSRLKSRQIEQQIVEKKAFQAWLLAYGRFKEAGELLRTARQRDKSRIVKGAFARWRKARQYKEHLKLLYAQARGHCRARLQSSIFSWWVLEARKAISHARVTKKLLCLRGSRALKSWLIFAKNTSARRRCTETAILQLARAAGSRARRGMRRWRFVTAVKALEKRIVARMRLRGKTTAIRVCFHHWERRFRMKRENRLERDTYGLSDALAAAKVTARTLEAELKGIRPALTRQGEELSTLQEKLLRESAEVSRLRSKNLTLTSGQKHLKKTLTSVVSAAKKAHEKRNQEAKSASKDAEKLGRLWNQAKEVSLCVRFGCGRPDARGDAGVGADDGFRFCSDAEKMDSFGHCSHQKGLALNVQNVVCIDALRSALENDEDDSSVRMLAAPPPNGNTSSTREEKERNGEEEEEAAAEHESVAQIATTTVSDGGVGSETPSTTMTSGKKTPELLSPEYSSSQPVRVSEGGGDNGCLMVTLIVVMDSFALHAGSREVLLEELEREKRRTAILQQRLIRSHLNRRRRANESKSVRSTSSHPSPASFSQSVLHAEIEKSMRTLKENDGFIKVDPNLLTDNECFEMQGFLNLLLYTFPQKTAQQLTLAESAFTSAMRLKREGLQAADNGGGEVEGKDKKVIRPIGRGHEAANYPSSLEPTTPTKPLGNIPERSEPVLLSPPPTKGDGSKTGRIDGLIANTNHSKKIDRRV